MSHSKRWIVVSLAMGVYGWAALAASWGCAAEDSPAASSAAAPDKDSKDEKAAAPGQDAGRKKEDPFVVPEGTAKELLAYVEKVRQLQPPQDDMQSALQFVGKQAKAILQAAEKALAAKPEPAQKKAALEAKLGALVMLSRLGDEDAAAKLRRLPEELEKAGQQELARQLRGMILIGDVQQAPDRQALKASLEAVKKFLAAGPLGPLEIQLADVACSLAERGGPADLARETYADFGKLLVASGDEGLARRGRFMLGAARRLGLPGQAMTLAGVTVDGKPFDWTRYAGKVVLVSFWATWCGPCKAEIVNVLKQHEAYHDRGFEVVGVSIDRDRKDVEQFLKDNEIPWTILLDDPAARRPAEKPGEKAGEKPEATPPKAAEAQLPDGAESMAEYYGVSAVPSTVLVGKDGKVVSLRARGKELQRQLKELLGPADAKERERKEVAK